MAINWNHNLQTLRDYQQACWDYRQEKKNNQVICIPTGGGKGSIITHHIVRNMQLGESTLIIVPTEELIINIYDRLKKFAPMYAALLDCASSKRKAIDWSTPYLLTTFQSLYRNLDKTIKFKHVLFDECHLSASPTALACLEYNKTAEHTGYTATPGRLDNKPLDYIYDEINMCPVSVRDLIDEGYLADFEVFGLPLEGFIDAYANRDRKNFDDGLSFQQNYLSNNKISREIWHNWQAIARNTPTIGFASGHTHAEMLTEMFNENYSVKKWAFMTNQMKYKERKDILEAYQRGDLIGVWNINMLTMGVDAPHTKTILQVRKTQSDNLHRQQLGRAMRPDENGNRAKFLDFVGNIRDHGSPAFPKEYSLQSDPDRKITDPIVTCPHCKASLSNRSQCVKLIKRFWETGNMNKLFLDIGEPRSYQVNDSRTGELKEVLEAITMIVCEQCGDKFKKKFVISGEIEERQNRGVFEVSNFGELVKLDSTALDDAILEGRLGKLINGKGKIQHRRQQIISGDFTPEQKVNALVKLGETLDAARMYAGIED